MDDFDKLLAGMVEVGKKAKAAPRKKKARATAGSTTPEVSRAVNPWTDEALVLLSTNIICDNCGNESLSWNASLYIERKNTRRRAPITQLEILTPGNYSAVYGALPKRTEVLVKHSCACPHCFGIGDNRANALIGEISPYQQPLLQEK